MSKITGLGKVRLAYKNTTGLPTHIFLEAICWLVFSSWWLGLSLCFSAKTYENMGDCEQENTMVSPPVN